MVFLVVTAAACVILVICCAILMLAEKKVWAVLCAMLAIPSSLCFFATAPLTVLFLIPLLMIIFLGTVFYEPNGKDSDLNMFFGVCAAYCAAAIYIPILSHICVG